MSDLDNNFEEYSAREHQLVQFNKWADHEGLDLKMSGEFEHSNKETHMAYNGFKAGQQSRQKEIDEINLTIKRLITSEEDIARGCKHWRDAHRELDERLDKVLDALCESGKTKEYRIEHAICLLKGERFVW